MSLNLVVGLAAFAILALLWLGFAVAAALKPSALDRAWRALRGLPLIVQALIWLLILPVALGLWIWETSWPAWLRLLLVGGLGICTVYTFFPR